MLGRGPRRGGAAARGGRGGAGRGRGGPAVGRGVRRNLALEQANAERQQAEKLLREKLENPLDHTQLDPVARSLAEGTAPHAVIVVVCNGTNAKHALGKAEGFGDSSLAKFDRDAEVDVVPTEQESADAAILRRLYVLFTQYKPVRLTSDIAELKEDELRAYQPESPAVELYRKDGKDVGAFTQLEKISSLVLATKDYKLVSAALDMDRAAAGLRPGKRCKLLDIVLKPSVNVPDRIYTGDFSFFDHMSDWHKRCSEDARIILDFDGSANIIVKWTAASKLANRFFVPAERTEDEAGATLNIRAAAASGEDVVVLIDGD